MSGAEDVRNKETVKNTCGAPEAPQTTPKSQQNKTSTKNKIIIIK